jgi:DNA-binding response OmpR family regulator
VIGVVVDSIHGLMRTRSPSVRTVRTCIAPVPIMVTTKGEEQNVEAGFESDCSDSITKPINGAELLTKVRGFLGNGGGA